MENYSVLSQICMLVNIWGENKCAFGLLLGFKLFLVWSGLVYTPNFPAYLFKIGLRLPVVEQRVGRLASTIAWLKRFISILSFFSDQVDPSYSNTCKENKFNTIS